MVELVVPLCVVGCFRAVGDLGGHGEAFDVLGTAFVMLLRRPMVACDRFPLVLPGLICKRIVPGVQVTLDEKEVVVLRANDGSLLTVDFFVIV